jgi:hypothetical protein
MLHQSLMRMNIMALRDGTKKLYENVDKIRNRYGKHTLYLDSGHLANEFSQHLGERGDIPTQQHTLGSVN